MDFKKLLLGFISVKGEKANDFWSKIADRSVNRPEDLTPEQAFQVGRMIERMQFQFSKDDNWILKNKENIISQLEELKVNILNNLITEKAVYKVTYYDNGGNLCEFGYYTMSGFNKSIKQRNEDNPNDKLREGDFEFEEIGINY